MITIIAALNHEGIIGLNGDIPWHISADLKRFRDLTIGHPIVMGRKTFESLPNGPLPFRTNIVLTSRQNYDIEHDIIQYRNEPELESFLKSIKPDVQIFIIGGSSLYTIGIPLADRLELTFVDYDGNGDTFFPEFFLFPTSTTENGLYFGAGDKFKIISREDHDGYSFQTYDRMK